MKGYVIVEVDFPDSLPPWDAEEIYSAYRSLPYSTRAIPIGDPINVSRIDEIVKGA